MDVIYLGLSELRKLIESSLSSNTVRMDDAIKCIATVEVLYEVERIKKDDILAQALKLVKNRQCELYSIIDCGYIVTADLNIDSLENGLFKVCEDYYSFEFWDDAIKSTVGPVISVKIISLRSFDLIWGTALCSNTIIDHL